MYGKICQALTAQKNNSSKNFANSQKQLPENFGQLSFEKANIMMTTARIVAILQLLQKARPYLIELISDSQ